MPLRSADDLLAVEPVRCTGVALLAAAAAAAVCGDALDGDADNVAILALITSSTDDAEEDEEDEGVRAAGFALADDDADLSEDDVILPPIRPFLAATPPALAAPAVAVLGLPPLHPRGGPPCGADCSEEALTAIGLLRLRFHTASRGP